jgi:glucose-1-phosphate adenylyltransferase
VTPPAKFVHDEDGRRGMAISSLVSGDCIISGGTLHRSLLFTGVRQNSYSKLDEAVVLPGCHIGRGARITKAVVDRGVHIPDGLVIGEDPELDAQRFRRTSSGVCLVTRPMIERLNYR